MASPWWHCLQNLKGFGILWPLYMGGPESQCFWTDFSLYMYLDTYFELFRYRYFHTDFKYPFIKKESQRHKQIVTDTNRFCFGVGMGWGGVGDRVRFGCEVRGTAHSFWLIITSKMSHSSIYVSCFIHVIFTYWSAAFPTPLHSSLTLGWCGGMGQGSPKVLRSNCTPSF
jgi:hypothetical protein